MSESKEIQLEQLKQERHTTMVELVHASQATYAELEQARKEYFSISKFQFYKKRQAKQKVVALNGKMAQLEHQIESAHQKYQQGLKNLEG